MTSVNIEVTKNQKENAVNIIRRFSKRVKNSGLLRRARKIQYQSRPLSSYKKKSAALMRINKTKEIDRLKKLGKIPS